MSGEFQAWRFDMENAPREGEEILVLGADGFRYIVAGGWEENGAWVWNRPGLPSVKAVAWMRLPPPPQKENDNR